MKLEIEDNNLIDLNNLKKKLRESKPIGGSNREHNMINRIDMIRKEVIDIDNSNSIEAPPLLPRPDVISDGKGVINVISDESVVDINVIDNGGAVAGDDNNGYKTPPPIKRKNNFPPPLIRKQIRGKVIHINPNEATEKKKNIMKKMVAEEKKKRHDFNYIQRVGPDVVYSLFKKHRKEWSTLKKYLKLYIVAKEEKIDELVEVNKLQGYRISELLKRLED